MEQVDIDEVMQRFESLDQDGNGFVELHEIGVDRDANHDGFITQQEL